MGIEWSQLGAARIQSREATLKSALPWPCAVLLPPPGAISAVATIERPDLIGNLAAWADSRRSTQ